MRVTIHSSLNRKEYFFSTDHCQQVHAPETYPKGFVATSFYLPMTVVPRASLPSGIVQTVKDVITIFHSGDKEIPNPEKKYKVEY